jgi:tetratricopeptide (TPR) repeat protein
MTSFRTNRSWLSPFTSARARPALARLLGLAVLSSALLAPCPSHAAPPQDSSAPENARDTTQRVKELMRTGVAAYRNGHFEGARVAFAEAWRLRQHVAIASSLAEVEMKLGLYQDAAEHWEYVLKNAEDDRAANRSEAEEQLEACRRQLGRARISVAGGPAEVFVDGKSIGEFAVRDELWLAPGAHQFHVVADGREGPVQTVDIEVGNVSIVRLERASTTPEAQGASEEKPSALLPSPVAPRSPERDRGSGTDAGARTVVLITGAALTAAAAGVGIAFTLQAHAKEGDVKSLQKQIIDSGDPALAGSASHCRPPRDKEQAACDYLREALVAMDVANARAVGSFIASGAFAAATIATYFLWPTDEKPKGARQGRLVLAPWTLEGGHGVQLGAQF